MLAGRYRGDANGRWLPSRGSRSRALLAAQRLRSAEELQAIGHRLQGRVAERLSQHSPDDVGVTIVTVAELWFGARKGIRPQATRREIDAFLASLGILPFDRAAAEAYAELSFALERSDRPIGERDLLIASIARARKLVVVTHNVSEFGRVPGLRTEDWL